MTASTGPRISRVSALEGFRTIWSRANATFGDGIPFDGSRFGPSSGLQAVQATLLLARPDAGWTGSAADFYAQAHDEQVRAIDGIVALEERLAAEVDRSAAVVTAGRQDLESIRQWVDAAAARVPNTPEGERMVLSMISKASSDVQDVIVRSHGDLSAIAERIRVLGGRYQALGG